MSRSDVVVLGGGIIGLACARELAAGGLRVEVVERLPSGSAASHASAGMLTTIGEGLPRAFVDVCRDSRDRWTGFLAGLEAEVDRPIEHDDAGALVLALSETEAAGFDAYVEEIRAAGEEVEEVSLADLRRWVPDASPATRRALLLPGERRVDNVEVCDALAAAVARRGVTLSYGVEVERVEITQGGVVLHSNGDRGNGTRREAGLLVLAAGAWSGGIAGLPTLPVRPVRGQIARITGLAWSWRGIVRDREEYAVRRGESSLLVGSTLEEAGFEAQATAAGIRTLLEWMRRILPGLASAPVEAVWAGLRPATPDAMPLVGPLPGLPVVVATGHYRNGIVLTPWTAVEVARLVATCGPGLDLFSPTRFG